MPFLNYYITYKNFEQEDVEIQLQDISTLEDPPGETININLTGSDDQLPPSIIESANADDDKTASIKPKRLKIGFLSGEYDIDGVGTVVDVGTFSDGIEGRFLTRILIGNLSLPFLGGIILDDNSEPFQPRPNHVQLIATDGLNSLKDVELKTTDGEIPIGHYTIIEYIVMCLGNLAAGQQIHAVMNIYETDQNPTTEHAFSVTYLDALTFETDVDKREDCLTVLTKILDWCGCFICYDHDGWWIIRWDEYDNFEANVSTMRVGTFDGGDGSFQGYTNETFDKVIASDDDVDYEGYFMSMDSAQRRFQRKVNKVIHTYKFELPKDIPCNGQFSRGDLLTSQSGFRTYELDGWATGIDFPGAGTPTADAYIRRNTDVNSYETDRFCVLEPEASTSEMFIESCGIGVNLRDRFTFSFDWAFSADAAGSGGYTRRLGIIRLEGDDGTYWTLDENGKWFQSNVTWTVNLKILQQTIELGDDQTQFINFSVEAEELPADGVLYIMFLSESQSRYNVDVYINNIAFDYEARIGSGYPGVRRPSRPFIEIYSEDVTGQQHIVAGNEGSRKTVEKTMFISDSPKKIFKGATKKLDGSNYVLTETWTEWNNVSFTNERFAKYIVFQWWNQFRKTRTVIETDVQGIKSNTEGGTPGLIHRWKIKHGNEIDKFFLLCSIRSMNIRTCGWQGVFVEMSDQPGDRIYDDEHEFRYT